uniref:JmjC domain-containing protein n=1 Tax=Megaselia scalaris TaxID=36166 RepID=T1GI84_MEGSC
MLSLPALATPAKVTPLPSEPSTSMQILSPTTSTVNRFENKSKFSPSIVSTPSNFAPRMLQPKYHTPPTTYPPPIEAYPAPKINPNFLTPKFDRNLDRSRISSNLDSPYSSSVHKNLTFPSPSPLKIDSNSTPKSMSTPSGKVPASATPTKTDPLKDEIGNSSGWGYGFPTPGPKGKGSQCAKHPWNLKVLTNNPGSVLRSLGPVIGVTVPTLHVGMVFSACCWYRDPHGLSWIEYLHTGASKIWYGIPDDQSVNFRQALTQLIPTHCQNKTLWLPCDTVMVPPYMLTERGVSLCRIEQKPGEFVVIFPRAYTSSIATGYVVSESVYFATSSWLDLAKDDFKDIHDSCEPAMFSLEQLLFALAGDQRIPTEIISQAAGVTSTEKIMTEKSQKSKSKQIVPEEYLCETCRANLYISMVRTDENNLYCLQHALKNLNKGNIQAKQCTLIFSYNIEDIENLMKCLKDKLSQKKTSVVANCSKKFPAGSK